MVLSGHKCSVQLSESNGAHAPNYHEPYEAGNSNDGAQFGDIVRLSGEGVRAKHAHKCGPDVGGKEVGCVWRI